MSGNGVETIIVNTEQHRTEGAVAGLGSHSRGSSVAKV
jgi:hypothetical protein